MKKRNWYIVFLCTILHCYASSLWALNTPNQLSVVEKMTFHTEDSIPLTGLLCLPPNTYAKKIVVYIAPLNEYDNLIVPIISNRDTTTFLGKMVSHLVASGIGFFSFSMRYPCNTGNLLSDLEIMKTSQYRSQTLNTLAEDAINACRFLKKETRFANIPVGVWGHSAMGRAAIMSAVKCPEISYAVLLAPPSTDNFDDAEWQYSRGSLNYIHLKEYFTLLWYMVDDSTFTYRNIRYSNKNSSEIKAKFIDCAWDSFKRINRSVIANHESYDTIQHKASLLMKSSFSWNKTGNWNKIKGVEAQNPNDFIDTIMWCWHKPIDISFLKWNAEEWYPIINCPTLILFAEEDKVIDSFGSYKNVCAIKERHRKTKIEIDMIQGVNHSFKNIKTNNIENSVFDKVIYWLNKVM